MDLNTINPLVLTVLRIDGYVNDGDKYSDWIPVHRQGVVKRNEYSSEPPHRYIYSYNSLYKKNDTLILSWDVAKFTSEDMITEMIDEL